MLRLCKGIALHYNPQTGCIFVHSDSDYESCVYFGATNPRLLSSLNLEQSICLQKHGGTVTPTGRILGPDTGWGRRSSTDPTTSLAAETHVGNMLSLRGLFTCRMSHWRKSGRGVAGLGPHWCCGFLVLKHVARRLFTNRSFDPWAASGNGVLTGALQRSP